MGTTNAMIASCQQIVPMIVNATVVVRNVTRLLRSKLGKALRKSLLFTVALAEFCPSAPKRNKMF